MFFKYQSTSLNKNNLNELNILSTLKQIIVIKIQLFIE